MSEVAKAPYTFAPLWTLAFKRHSERMQFRRHQSAPDRGIGLHERARGGLIGRLEDRNAERLVTWLAPKAEKPKQFIYVLRLVPRLYSDSNWTEEDKTVLGRHFARFQEATKSGQLILAGRTNAESG
jgi:hypothetical protein